MFALGVGLVGLPPGRLVQGCTMILLATVDWDTDGASLKRCGLRKQVLIVDAPEGCLDDQAYLDDTLGDEISNIFGFCHNGVEYVPVALDRGFGPVDVLVMQAPEKIEE